MTFKETEFPAMIRFLKTLVQREANPYVIRDVIQQMVRLYEEVPLYPGIVNMCMDQVCKSPKAEELLVGQKVHFQQGDEFFSGTVAKKDAEGITIRHVRCIVEEDDYELGYKEIDKVTAINEKVLDELWPSLVFEKGRSR